MLQLGETVAGYRIEGLLGHGGMGRVYEATQLSLQRTVALKVLAPTLGIDARSRERFRREALAQAALDHPNVVTIHETGELPAPKLGEPPQPFIAMQLVRGNTLKELIRAGALTPERLVQILGGVAAALDAAHAAGLVHRDVKPQNVLVADSDGRPYLGDFGIVRAGGQETLTAAGELLGTLDYMAPEALAGAEPTPASDVYALAAVLFECLCGVPPFRRDTPSALVGAHLSAPPPRVSELRPELPPAIDEVVKRGLAKDPQHRQASAGRLVAEAASALGPETAATLRERVATLRERPARRAPAAPRRARVSRRTAYTALAVGVLALATASAVLLGGGGGEERGAGGSRPRAIPVGSELTRSGSTVECTGSGQADPCTILNTMLPDRRLTAPFDGVVVRWRVRDADGTVRLAVVRGGTQKKATVARSPRVRVAPGAPRELPARVPIARGDRVALELEQGARVGIAGYRGARLERYSPPLTSAPVGDVPATDPLNTEVLVGADIEPDADGDGFGDTSQDRCPGERGDRDGCR